MLPANRCLLLEGDSMARRRYQRGGIALRGKLWIFRWRDDVIEEGQLKRVERWVAFAEKKKYGTKREALRDPFVVSKQQEINSPTYRPLHRSNFREFADRWVKNVLINLEPSTQAGIRSHLGTAQKDPKRKAKRKLKPLVEVLGDLEMKDISPEIMQSMVTDYCKQGASPKTVKNLIATMRMLWRQVKAWGYATHDPFDGLVLPDPEPAEVPFYQAEQMNAVIASAEEPYRTLYWLTGQTGIRRGEVCALRVMDVILERNGQPLEQGTIIVRRKVWGGIIGRPKSKRPRVFALSPKLTERIREVCKGKEGEALLFTNSKGGMLDPDNLVKRHLKPALAKAGIEEGGMHAFRHGNATILDQNNAPMKIRQDRLGHVDPKTTLGYTHVIGEDEKRVAAEFDEILRADACKAKKEKAFEGSERFAIQ
jgi:integrase